jgi:hypothetical protein
MTDIDEVEAAVERAKRLLAERGYECSAGVEDLILWFEADTVYDADFGLDRVIARPLLVVHELVEIDTVKRMGLTLTKDVIVTNPEKVDDAHMVATEVELEIAASLGDHEHIGQRLDDIRMWMQDPAVTHGNRVKCREMWDRFSRELED